MSSCDRTGMDGCACLVGRLNEGDDELEFSTTKDLDVLSSFESMGLKEDLLRGIYAYGEERLHMDTARGYGYVVLRW